jgi:flagellar biosynthesis repressor protein FlbT
MQIHLKRGEKIYINGAVLRVDRRASIEFLNDVDFLLENHVIQAEEARTPLRQLYFVVQTMLMDPENAGMTHQLYVHLAHRLTQAASTAEILEAVARAGEKVAAGKYFDALKLLRGAFATEEQLLAAAPVPVKEEAA